jgi:benzoyl-CoA reductase/2-hydroxyglutaryl-CoA dehydratase subunit BcrC/BadD/HgdB
MITKWYEALARFFDVPLVFIDTPFIHDELTENAVDYVKRQLRRAIAQMESLLGQRLDMDCLGEVVDISGRATHMWGKVLEMCKNIPSPMNAFDGFILMAPIVTLRGTSAVVDFYEMLREELAGRVENGIAAVEGERYRLLWDNLPIWFRLRDLSERLIQHKACVVASTYLNGWVAHGLNPSDPIDSLSRTYMSSFINRGLEYRTKMLSEIIEEYSVDGIIFHSNRSCRPYSLGQYDIKDALAAQTGVPGILLEADMNDERVYADGPVINRIEAFIETLKPRQEKVAI